MIDGSTRTDCLALRCMFGLSMHVCLACLDCLICCRSRQRRSSPLETLDVTSLVLRRCGAGVWVHWCGDTKTPRLEYALESMFCMPSQHYAIGLQTGCMVIVLAPVVEAARLPRVCPMALGYGLPPCHNNGSCQVVSASSAKCSRVLV